MARPCNDNGQESTEESCKGTCAAGQSSQEVVALKDDDDSDQNLKNKSVC